MNSNAGLESGRQRKSAELGQGLRDGVWTRLANKIQAGDVTPVIGPLLARGILGSREDIARHWVSNWDVPILEHGQGDLAQVAQYMRVYTNDKTLRYELQSHLMGEIRERRERRNPDDWVWDLPNRLVADEDPSPAILEVGRRLRTVDEDDPYRTLANLDTDVYVTTGWTDLLQEALRDKERQPITMAFKWKGAGEREPRPMLPTVERPLVYHLYGRLDDLDSLVLSEDDYFTWLNEWALRRESVPPFVRRALTAKSLLFLGYRMDDWDFRVVFQTIWNLGGSSLLANENNQHVGVQFTHKSQMFKPEAAQQYLESYFDRAHVRIYWGETRQFLNEIRDRIFA